MPKTDDWKKEVEWADVIVFDDVLGQGADAKKLRDQGKLVVGGTPYTDRLEDDREFGQEELKKYDEEEAEGVEDTEKEEEVEEGEEEVEGEEEEDEEDEADEAEVVEDEDEEVVAAEIFFKSATSVSSSPKQELLRPIKD